MTMPLEYLSLAGFGWSIFPFVAGYLLGGGGRDFNRRFQAIRKTLEEIIEDDLCELSNSDAPLPDTLPALFHLSTCLSGEQRNVYEKAVREYLAARECTVAIRKTHCGHRFMFPVPPDTKDAINAGEKLLEVIRYL